MSFKETNPPRTRKLSLCRPEISIFLKTGSGVTYTTLDKIEGTVSVTASQDTAFDALSIEFRGQALEMVHL